MLSKIKQLLQDEIEAYESDAEFAKARGEDEYYEGALDALDSFKEALKVYEASIKSSPTQRVEEEL